MLPLIVNPQQEKHVNLGILDAKNCFVTKINGNGGRSTAASAQSGGYNFGDNKITIGSTIVNSRFIVADDIGSLINGTSNLIGSSDCYLTTYGGNTPQMRIMVPINTNDGKSLSRILVDRFDVNRLGSSVTGTLNIRLCKMNSSGTVTTIATASYLIPDATGGKVGLFGSGTPVSFSSSDFIVVEMEILQTSGTHNTSNYITANFQGFLQTALFFIS